MAFTVDTYTLNVCEFSEASEPVAVDWKVWDNCLVLKRNVYGLKRAWRLSCVEKDIAWTNSAALYLRNKAASGEAVTFTVDEGDRYQLPATKVYVTHVEIVMELVGGQNIRHFTVTFKEV